MIPKIYYDRAYAVSDRFYLNNVAGFAPAHIYRVDCVKAWVVLRAWDMKRTTTFRALSLTLDD